MNRREFIRILSAAAMVPMIGLPAVVPGAPAVEFTRDELAKIAEECLVDLEEKEPFRSYFVFVGDPEQTKHYYPGPGPFLLGGPW